GRVRSERAPRASANLTREPAAAAASATRLVQVLLPPRRPRRAAEGSGLLGGHRRGQGRARPFVVARSARRIGARARGWLDVLGPPRWRNAAGAGDSVRSKSGDVRALPRLQGRSG